jgi:Cof subfamily protein (haloacid dehalogenase superfamily)
MNLPPEKIKLMALDLDGTILNRKHEMSERTASAIRAARIKGYQVVLCTGRRYTSCLDIIERLGCLEEIIIDNGIIVKDTTTDETIYADYLSSDVYGKLVSVVRDIGLPFIVLIDDYPEPDIYTESLDGTNPYHREFIELNISSCRIFESLDEPPTKKVIQLAIFEEYSTLQKTEANLKKSVEHLADCFTIRAIRYMGSSLELIPKGASKWKALSFLLDSKEIAPEEVLAIGDDVNDIPMIFNAGFGVAMANAFDEVKAAADYIAPDRDEDGAAATIEKLL